jgi:hypothetical protein
MRFNVILLAVFTSPVFLAGCGGSGGTNPYDGTWQAVYPALSQPSSITDTKTVLCDNPPATLNMTDAKGTVTIKATCDTTTYTISIDPTTGSATKTADPGTPFTQEYDAYVSVTIVPQGFGDKDILNATVNGATFTGQCISTVACSAADAAGDTLSLTR